MTNRKPTPLKDEKPDPIEEVQEQLAELIAAVNSLAEKGTATAEHQPDERFQKTLSTAVVKAVQDLLEARQRMFEEADKGKMTINEILQEILGQYDDICGKAKGFYQIYQGADARFKHIDENLQKISGNQKILYGMMKTVQQAHNIKPDNECKRPAMPSGFKDRLKYFAFSLPLYGLKRVYLSRHVRFYVKICLFCIWVITIATAAFIAYDNSVLRKENYRHQMLHQYLRKDTNAAKRIDKFDSQYYNQKID